MLAEKSKRPLPHFRLLNSFVTGAGNDHQFLRLVRHGEEAMTVIDRNDAIGVAVLNQHGCRDAGNVVTRMESVFQQQPDR